MLLKLYKYHHTTQAIPGNIASLLPCYCYKCGAQVTMPKATNECYSYDDTGYIIQTWNFIARSSTNERSKCGYHSLLCSDIHFWFLTLHVSSVSDKHWGEKSWVWS